MPVRCSSRSNLKDALRRSAIGCLGRRKHHQTKTSRMLQRCKRRNIFDAPTSACSYTSILKLAAKLVQTMVFSGPDEEFWISTRQTFTWGRAISEIEEVGKEKPVQVHQSGKWELRFEIEHTKRPVPNLYQLKLQRLRLSLSFVSSLRLRCKWTLETCDDIAWAFPTIILFKQRRETQQADD